MEIHIQPRYMNNRWVGYYNNASSLCLDFPLVIQTHTASHPINQPKRNVRINSDIFSPSQSEQALFGLMAYRKRSLMCGRGMCVLGMCVLGMLQSLGSWIHQIDGLFFNSSSACCLAASDIVEPDII